MKQLYTNNENQSQLVFVEKFVEISRGIEQGWNSSFKRFNIKI